MFIQTKYLFASLKSIFEVATQINILSNRFSLELPLHAKSEIHGDKYEGLWNLNPTLAVNENGFNLFCRSTNARFFPSANLKGEMKLEKFGTGVRNQTFELLVDNKFEIQSQQIIIDTEGIQSFEDPRFVSGGTEDFLVGTVVIGDPEVSNNSWETKVGIYNLATGKLSVIKSPTDRRFEKNWVPIVATKNVVTILHSNNPQIILEVDAHSGEILEIKKGPQSNFLSLNGGSQFVFIQGENLYVRVARKRYSFWRLGTIHLSYLVIHDSSLREVQCSRPFIFSKLGFEICNGLGLDTEGNLVFTWGEDDYRILIGKMPLREVLAWIERNRFRKRKFTNVKGIFHFFSFICKASKKNSPRFLS